MATKQRVHREWFFPLAHTKCRNCKTRDTVVWGWYEYVNAKKRHVRDICSNCVESIVGLLKDHAGDCGCTFVLEVRGKCDTMSEHLEKIQERLNA
jgi:hypothetical protein